MYAKLSLNAALLRAFQLDEESNGSPSNELAAAAATEILCAFAQVLRGPVVEVAGIEAIADETPALILAELRSLRADLVALRASDEASSAVLINPAPDSLNRYASKADVNHGGATTGRSEPT